MQFLMSLKHLKYRRQLLQSLWPIQLRSQCSVQWDEGLPTTKLRADFFYRWMHYIPSTKKERERKNEIHIIKLMQLKSRVSKKDKADPLPSLEFLGDKVVNNRSWLKGKMSVVWTILSLTCSTCYHQWPASAAYSLMITPPCFLSLYRRDYVRQHVSYLSF